MRYTIAAIILLLFLTMPKANAQKKDDSLTKVVFISQQTAQADSLTQLALNISQPGAAKNRLNQALDHVDKALHIYARFRDSTGIRNSFDNMAFIYHLQQLHSQEKWYILQSNTLSRARKDTLNIIKSLIKLVIVKCAIKDNDLAAKDDSEALYLAQSLNNSSNKIAALQTIADGYQQIGDKKNLALLLNRIHYLTDSVHNSQLAKLKVSDTPMQNIKQGSPNPSVVTRVITFAEFNFYKILILLLIITLSIFYYIVYLDRKSHNSD